MFFTVVCWRLDIGVVEFGWASWWREAARSNETRHWSSPMLPIQCWTAPGDATRWLRQSLWLCVISDVVCRVPRWLRVATVAPCSSLQARISRTMRWQVVEGISIYECFYFVRQQMCYIFCIIWPTRTVQSYWSKSSGSEKLHITLALSTMIM